MYNTLNALCVLGKSAAFSSGWFSFANLVAKAIQRSVFEHLTNNLKKWPN
jgi:hypothetical protein